MRARFVARPVALVLTLALLLSCGGSGGGGSALPGSVTDFLATHVATPSRIELSWTMTTDPDPAGVILVRSVGAPVSGCARSGGGPPPGSMLPGGGDVVFAGPGTSHVDSQPPTGFYHYAAFCYVGANVYGAPATCTALVPQAFVYSADQETDNITELFVGDVGMPGTSTRLNAPLRPGSSLVTVAGDDTQLIYRTDHDTAGLDEIYRAVYADPGNVSKVNGPFPVGTTIDRVVLHPAGTHVAYVADPETLGTSECYLVDLAVPGAPAKVNPALPAGADVTDSVSFSPDGTRLCYIADQIVLGVQELFVAQVAPLGTTVKMNAGLVVPGGDVTDAAISPDGVHVFYIADQQTDGVYELFRTKLAFPTLSSQVSGALVPGGGVHDFTLSPDGQWIVYEADQVVVGQRELWLRPTDLSVPAVRLNGVLSSPAMMVREPIFHADSSAVLYRSDELFLDKFELFLVAVSAPGAPVKLNSFLFTWGDVVAATFSADCDRVVWVADAFSDNVFEVFVTNTASPGTSALLSDPFPPGGDVISGVFTFDGEQVLYAAEQDTPGVTEAYATRVEGTGGSVKLNPALVPGGNVGVVFPIPIRHLQRQID